MSIKPVSNPLISLPDAGTVVTLVFDCNFIYFIL